MSFGFEKPVEVCAGRSGPFRSHEIKTSKVDAKRRKRREEEGEEEKREKKKMENRGFDPRTSRMRSERSAN